MNLGLVSVFFYSFIQKVKRAAMIDIANSLHFMSFIPLPSYVQISRSIVNTTMDHSGIVTNVYRL